MVKQIIPAIAFIILLGSCTSLKQLNFTGSRQVASTSVNSVATVSKAKFLDEISVTPQASAPKEGIKTDPKETVVTRVVLNNETAVKEDNKPISDIYSSRSDGAENISALQLKYAVLLNTEAEQLQNTMLLQGIDEWYGTRYRMGGTTKKGIDCSAFVEAIYTVVYGISLPRTAWYQYKVSRRISRTELQEGDLLFFNTRGGISHVGIYLQNNKFVHASATLGVTISDMFDTYYLKRFVGAGRIDNKQGPVASY